MAHGPISAVSCRAPAGYGCELETDADACRKVGVGGVEKSVKNCEICPTHSQHPNQFVQRPRVAGRLQRSMLSGRSVSVRISEKHTTAQESA